jgi:hypothetical protein
MVMDSKSQFLLELLAKLGSPLLQAVNAQAAQSDGAQGHAQTVAMLMSETVKISIALSQAMNLKTDDGDADAIRVALAALAAKLVAESYAQSGRMPGEQESQRIIKSLESVLAFSDNFAPAAEHAQRLQTLAGTAPFFDPLQTNLYAINALVPAIAAVAEFSFGQPETKLIQEISARLSERTAALRSTLLTGIVNVPDEKMADMVILQGLSQLYASVHRAETSRLRALPEDQRGADLSIQPVWDSFDRQIAMLEVLIASMTGASIAGGGRGSSAVKPAAEQQAPAEPAKTEPVTTPARPAGGNPMSFFKKPGA